MPVYCYECQGCGHTFDVVLPIDQRMEPMQDPCPKCEKDTQINRLMQEALIARNHIRNPLKKMPEDFKERMRNIKKANPEMRSDHF